MSTKIRVAAVQMACRNGEIERNLARAVTLVEEAAARGAELVIVPELVAAGYVFSEAIWDGAEPKHGPTVRFLREQSRRHGIYLGASFLEASGEDFYNTFVLTTPTGEEAGRVRKQTPALFEAFFTKGEPGPHTIHTDLGVIGVGICYENQLSFLPGLFVDADVDLVLMPHSAPSPARGNWLADRGADYFEALLRSLPTYYAEALGVPVVMVNKCGPWVSPIPFVPFMTQRSRFPGLSAIADGDGALRVRLEAHEGVIVDDVVLDPTRKTHACPPCRGRWSRAAPLATELARVPEIVGAAWYARSAERRRRARAV